MRALLCAVLLLASCGGDCRDYGCEKGKFCKRDIGGGFWGCE